MGTKADLNQARVNKKDEFYTLTETIEKELRNYKEQFKGQRIYCPCDDARWSNFWWYFFCNFNHLGLKSLDATCFHAGQHGEHWHYEGGCPTEDIRKAVWEKDRSKVFKYCDYEVLEDEGGFQNRTDILVKTDVVVTNPPFSLLKDFVPFIIEHDNKILFLSNTNCLTYKSIFPYIKEGKLWAGYDFHKTVEFIMADDYELKGKAYIDDDGKKHGFVQSISWFTNLKTKKLSKIYEYYQRYDPNIHKHYDNSEVINVDYVKQIPCDWTGVMGVPITWLDKYCPEQFEIVRDCRWENSDKYECVIDGVTTYWRIFIRWKPEAMPEIRKTEDGEIVVYN